MAFNNLRITSALTIGGGARDQESCTPSQPQEYNNARSQRGSPPLFIHGKGLCSGGLVLATVSAPFCNSTVVVCFVSLQHKLPRPDRLPYAPELESDQKKIHGLGLQK